MSDWDDTFGVDASVEGMIDGINRRYFRGDKPILEMQVGDKRDEARPPLSEYDRSFAKERVFWNHADAVAFQKANPLVQFVGQASSGGGYRLKAVSGAQHLKSGHVSVGSVFTRNQKPDAPSES